MEGAKAKVRSFIVDNFLFGDASGLEDHASLLDKGIIDSTGILELVEFLTEEFSISIADEELVPENLDSIDNVTAFLRRKTAGTPPAPVGSSRTA